MSGYSVAMIGNMAGQVIINSLASFTGSSSGPGLVEEATDTARVFRDAWQAQIMPALSSQYSFDRVEARSTTNPLIIGSVTATVPAGNAPGAPLPTFACARIKLNTATPGRAGRGRTGLAGIRESTTLDNAPNTLDLGTVSDLQTRMDAFLAALLAATPSCKLAVVSRFQGTTADGQPVPRPGGPLTSFVTSIQVQTKLGTRVSRLR